MASLPAPDLLAAEIVEHLQNALDRFASVAADLGIQAEQNANSHRGQSTT